MGFWDALNWILPKRVEDMLEKEWIVAGGFALVAILTSVFLIFKHFRNYNKPVYQKYIVRILCMVPLYSLESWLSIVIPDSSPFFETLRDVYEAFVIYTFLSLLIAYLGGENELGNLLEMKRRMAHPWPLHCIKFQPGARFLRYCKQGTLQFVFVKPLTALTSLILFWCNRYEEGNFDYHLGYLYISIINNVSVSISLYALVLFYMATKDNLADFHPLLKFTCVKAVVFFSYWQGFVLAVLVKYRILTEFQDYSADRLAAGIQDFLICFEMCIAAITHHFAFSYNDFKEDEETMAPLLTHVKEVLDVHELLSDARTTFAKHPNRDFEMKEGFATSASSSTTSLRGLGSGVWSDSNDGADPSATTAAFDDAFAERIRTGIGAGLDDEQDDVDDLYRAVRQGAFEDTKPPVLVSDPSLIHTPLSAGDEPEPAPSLPEGPL